MATKPKNDIPSDIQEKIDAYADLHGVPASSVVELALRDFFYDYESGKRPRSNSAIEPVLEPV
jgi:hypothetical protein